MKKNFKDLAARARGAASQVGDTASVAASIAVAKAREATSIVGSSVGERLSEENLRKLSAKTQGAAQSVGSQATDIARKISESDAARGGKALLARARNAADFVGEKHAEIADHADTAAKATKVAAGAAVIGAAAAAPTGLTAVGVSLGIVSAPAIVTGDQ